MSATPDSMSANPDPRIADLERQLADREAELAEAREQQTATAEVLQVINSSPGDLAPVFDAMLEKAHSLCEAAHGALLTYDGEHFRAVALRAMPRQFGDLLLQPFPPHVGGAQERLLQGDRLVHIPDIATHEAHTPIHRAAIEAGIRTLLMVALRKDDALLGYITAHRREVRPFSDKHIALLENFAAQAVIAMENARLLTETHEALEQQTATAEVLQVINSSPGDLAPIFDAILEKAHSLCGVTSGGLIAIEGEQYRALAVHGDPKFAEYWMQQGWIPSTIPAQLRRAEHIHVPDLAEDEVPKSEHINRLIELSGTRSMLVVPLRKDGVLFGAITALRNEVRPFTDKQIALLENFAAQAVIAMENARLLTETREALEQQSATAEVLQVINSSPGDLAPVFDAMLDKALHLCGAAFGQLLTYDGERFHSAALKGVPAAFADFMARNQPTFGPGTVPARILAGERVVHVIDLKDDDTYRKGAPTRRALVDLGGARSLLSVPLLKDERILGTIMIYRQEVQSFTEKQIALLQNFAAQAVVAMENARLLTETREALEQQTATAEVLGVINVSPGDLAPVFDAILEKAMRLCEAAFGLMSIYRSENFYSVAHRGVPAALREFLMNETPPPGPHSVLTRILAGDGVVHVEDLSTSPQYLSQEPRACAMVDLGGTRSYVAVALRKDDTLLGIIGVYRQEVRPFTDRQIALLQNFAAQAVIAMENARLLGELRQRTDEVAELNRGLEARVAEQVEELGRVGRLKRFLAPQLAELIVSQGDEKILESHRREIVVVFCDLRGYTAFTETAEPEEVLDFLREYHGALGPLVSQFEGTLDQFSGDGIMVFFNDPVPCPDPAERAVKMAMAMREAASKLIAAWRRRGRVLGFGAGIAQGYATLGQIGFADRSGYTAIGTVCNLAARLCAEAKDGQILVAQRVAVSVEATTPLEEVGELTLKGLTQPVLAYNLPLVGSQAGFRVVEGGASSA